MGEPAPLPGAAASWVPDDAARVAASPQVSGMSGQLAHRLPDRVKMPVGFSVWSSATESLQFRMPRPRWLVALLTLSVVVSALMLALTGLWALLDYLLAWGPWPSSVPVWFLVGTPVALCCSIVACRLRHVRYAAIAAGLGIVLALGCVVIE